MGMTGKRHSEETKARMSATRKGRKPTVEALHNHKKAVNTREYKEKMRALKTGLKHSEADLVKMRGRRHTEDEKRRMIAVHKGRKRSPETCARISAKAKGRQPTDDARAKISAAMKGRIMTSEHRARIGLANSRRKLSKESRAKISASLKANREVVTRLQTQGPFWDSKPAILVRKFIEENQIDLRKEFWLPELLGNGIYHKFDVYIPHVRLLVEVDGCYWHACPAHCPDGRRPKSDLEINELFNAGGYEGYSLVRLWEHDINSGVAFPILLKTIREMESKFAA